MKKSKITINGRTFQGDNIAMNGNDIMIDGKAVYDASKESNPAPINITVEGNVRSLNIPQCENIEVMGDVDDLETMNGNVRVGGNVNGDVETMNGNVKAHTIKGDVETFNGDVTTGILDGEIETFNGRVIKETLKEE